MLDPVTGTLVATVGLVVLGVYLLAKTLEVAVASFVVASSFGLPGVGIYVALWILALPVMAVGHAVVGVVWGLACLALKVLDLGAYIAHRAALRRA